MRIKKKLAGHHVEDTQKKKTISIAVLNLVMFKKSRAFKLCLMKVEKQESCG